METTKELTIEEKAEAYDKVVNKLKGFMMQGVNPLITRNDVQDFFPELKESEDERIRKEIIATIHLYYGKPLEYEAKEMIAWLEKQGEQKSVINVPPREVILAIWDLGNEWKELTNGSISTEYGTQLDYIQKHWQESEYYLREKQGE